MEILAAIHTLLLCSTRTQVGGLAFESLSLVLTGNPNSNSNNSESSSPSATTAASSLFFSSNFALVPITRSSSGGLDEESPIEIDFERYKAPNRRTGSGNGSMLHQPPAFLHQYFTSGSAASSTRTTPTATRHQNDDASLPLAPGFNPSAALHTGNTTPSTHYTSSANNAAAPNTVSSTTATATTNNRIRHRRTASDPWSYIKAHTPGVLLSFPYASPAGAAASAAAGDKKGPLASAGAAPPPLPILTIPSTPTNIEETEATPLHLDSVKVIVRTKMAFALWDTASVSAGSSPVVVCRTTFVREFYFVRAVSKLVAAGSGTLTVAIDGM